MDGVHTHTHTCVLMHCICGLLLTQVERVLSDILAKFSPRMNQMDLMSLTMRARYSSEKKENAIGQPVQVPNGSL